MTLGLALVLPLLLPAHRGMAAETRVAETAVEEPSAAEVELEGDIPALEPSNPERPEPLGDKPAMPGEATSVEDEALELLEEVVEAETLQNEGSEDVELEEAELQDSERVYLAERQISFVPPTGFTAMSDDEINLKFPGSMPPQFAYANERRNVSIGVSLSDIDLAPEQLPEVRQFLESFLEESVPGFDWVARDYESMGGNRWIKLEFISQALDTRVHNDLYITSFKGKLLGFNFNSVLSLEEKLRPQLDNSRASISLDPLATAQGDRVQ